MLVNSVSSALKAGMTVREVISLCSFPPCVPAALPHCGYRSVAHHFTWRQVPVGATRDQNHKEVAPTGQISILHAILRTCNRYAAFVKSVSRMQHPGFPSK
jgi:hypothetical protein